MLTELHIENLGVIERAELVLQPGMTALTGETGAGKTMLVERFRQMMNAGQRSDRVFSVDVPGAPSLMRLLAALRRAFQAPARSGGTLADREDQVLVLLGNLRPAAVVLDEFHNVLDSAPRERKMIIAFLRAWGKLHVVPVLVGDDWKAALLWRTLYDAGVYVNVALHPAVPPGGALLRTSVMATHDRATLDRALAAFADVKAAFEAEHGPLPGSP